MLTREACSRRSKARLRDAVMEHCHTSMSATEKQADLFTGVLGSARGGGLRATRSDDPYLTDAQHQQLRSMPAMCDAERFNYMYSLAAQLNQKGCACPQAFTVNEHNNELDRVPPEALSPNLPPLQQANYRLMTELLDGLLRRQPTLARAARMYALSLLQTGETALRERLADAWWNGVKRLRDEEPLDDRTVVFLVSNYARVPIYDLARDLGMTVPRLLRCKLALQIEPTRAWSTLLVADWLGIDRSTKMQATAATTIMPPQVTGSSSTTVTVAVQCNEPGSTSAPLVTFHTEPVPNEPYDRLRAAAVSHDGRHSIISLEEIIVFLRDDMNALAAARQDSDPDFLVYLAEVAQSGRANENCPPGAFLLDGQPVRPVPVRPVGGATV